MRFRSQQNEAEQEVLHTETEEREIGCVCGWVCGWGSNFLSGPSGTQLLFNSYSTYPLVPISV